MKFRPLHDRVVVRRVDAEEKTKLERLGRIRRQPGVVRSSIELSMPLGGSKTFNGRVEWRRWTELPKTRQFGATAGHRWRLTRS